MFRRPAFLVESAIGLLFPVLFLGATLPEVWRATALVVELRRTSHPEISLIQAWSGAIQWACGAYAIVVVAFLAYAAAFHRPFRFGVAFWLALVAGLVNASLMFMPFGPLVTAAVSVPLLLLAAHATYLIRGTHAA